jgi:hypothetical protein
MTTPFTLTDHAVKRCSQRGITDHQIQVAITYGKLLYRQGFRFYFLRGKDVPPWVDPHTLGRMKNLMVVISPDTAYDPSVTVITAYKNVGALRRVKRKTRHLL